MQGFLVDGNVFFRNNSSFIHGPDLAYMLFFKNNDYLDNYYLEKRQSVFPQEIWLPDSIIHMTNAHQFSLNYNLGLDKRINENHFLLFYIGFGGMMYKLPERIDKFNNLTYFWKNSLFGLNSNINIGYGYKFQNNIAIQISYELNFAYLFKESYDNYNEVNRSIFQLAYMLKFGIAKYF